MIRVYDSSEKLFNNNGIKILHPLSAIVFKEDNGDYYIEVEDSIEKVDYYQASMIINCPTPFPEGNQSFRIVKIEKTNTRIKVKANHVYFDTDNYMIDDKYIVDKDCNYALNYLNKNCDVETPFTTNSDVTSTNSYRCVRKPLSEAITTLIDRWGGHLVRDNFNISIKQNIGVDRGVVVKYRKNITSIRAEEVWDNVVTKIMPVGKNGLLLPEKYLEVKDKLYDIPFSKIVKIDQDLEQEKNESDEDFTERLIANLRLKAKSYLEENKYPKVNYNLSANLDNITDVGDIIYVDHPKLNIKMTTNVISVKWDVISKKYKNIEFGNFRNKLKDLLKNMNTIANEISKDNSNETKSFLEKELIDATNKIWGTLGNSFVIYDGDKILIVDKLPKEKAKNVILMNNGGIGFSNTGINGTFATAWTIDGGFNANFITSGKIDTSLIEGYDNLTLSVNKLVDVTRTLTANNYIEITDAAKGSIISFSIKGDLSLFFLSNQTFLGSNTFFKSSNLVVEDINGNKKKIQTNIGKLNTLNGVYDEFVTDDTGSYIIRRIGVNNDLSLYTLDNEVIEKLLLVNIELNEGYNKIYMESFSNLIYTITYAKKNDYTDIFTRRVEMNALINVNNENIDLKLEKKTDKNQIIAQINMSTEKNEDGSLIQIESDRLNLKNKKFNLLSDQIEIESPNFSVTKEGNIASKSGEIGGFVIDENKLYGIHKKNVIPFTEDDVTKIRNYLMGNITLTDEEIEYLDYDKDGKVTSRDYILINNLVKNSNNEYTIEFNSKYIDKLLNIQDENGQIISRIGTEGAIFNSLKTTGDFYFANQNNSNYRFFSSCNDTADFVSLQFDAAKTGAFQIYSVDENSISLKTSLYQNGTIDCVLLNQTSLESSKKNFEKFTSAIEEIMATDIYQYNLKSESDDHKKHLGFVIGDKYNYSHLITSVDNDGKEIGVDNYSMTALCLQAIKEQQLIIEKLESKIKELEVKINGSDSKKRI